MLLRSSSVAAARTKHLNFVHKLADSSFLLLVPGNARLDDFALCRTFASSKGLHELRDVGSELGELLVHSFSALLFDDAVRLLGRRGELGSLASLACSCGSTGLSCCVGCGRTSIFDAELAEA